MVSAMRFYAFHLMLRENRQNSLHLFGDLFQQFVVDMYAKIEQSRLNYIRNNQQRLRIEVLRTGTLEDVGRRVILPSSLSYQNPRQLRRLFATIILFCQPSNPFRLWTEFKEHLTEDYIHRKAMALSITNLSDPQKEECYGHCLLDRNDLLLDGGQELTAFAGFTLPDVDTRTQDFGSMSDALREHMSLNAAAASLPDPALLPFKQSQRQVYDFIMNLVRAAESNTPFPKAVFVDGPGGTGKTFLFNALLDAVRRENNIAIAVAYSGTAATLLKGGRTAHSTFKIPLQVSPETVCNVSPRSDVANLLRQARLIVWDEASMISKDQIETVDRTFRDIMKSEDPRLSDVPFGGKLFVFGGDFRQVLPVIPHATRAKTVSQCFNHSTLWSHVHVKRLTMNMRVQQALASNDPELASTLQNFANYLLSIGSGTVPTLPGTDDIPIPNDMLFDDPDDSFAFADAVFNHFRTADDMGTQALISRTILTPKNSDVAAINDYILGKFPGEYVEYLSADSVVDEKFRLSYPVEYLNSMNPGSLPPHHLKLKVGTPVMVLRNLSPRNGVCNGTRLICRSFRRNVIEAIIATGPNAGEAFLIPRVNIMSNEQQTVIPFMRKQFPIRPAFAMTINKAQGQTLDSVGLYLPEPVFGHGQLYVAFSRVKRPDAVKVFLKKDRSTVQGYQGYFTKNIVYREVIE